MSGDKRLTRRVLEIWLARVFHRVGIAGVAGGAALVAGAALIITHRPHDTAELVLPVPRASLASPAASAAVAPAASASLSPAGDVPLLLTQIERAAVAQGLGWPQAEYRILHGTADTPASLEVHCVLKGPYPSLRRFLTTLLTTVPALGLREFSLSRPNADTADVEAKLGIVVYLAEAGRL